jgi:hypothetical protein
MGQPIRPANVIAVGLNLAVDGGKGFVTTPVF